MTLQTVVYTINLKNSYSIFRRTTGFGKLDSLVLFFRSFFSAVSEVSFCLLFVPSTGLPKGEMNFISTGGGDQEPSFLVVLKRKRSIKLSFFLPTVFSRGKKPCGITKSMPENYLWPSLQGGSRQKRYLNKLPLASIPYQTVPSILSHYSYELLEASQPSF